MNTGKLRVWALYFVINMAGFGLLALSWLKGLVELVIVRDTSYICIMIFALFLVGLVLAYLRIRGVNRMFDDIAGNTGEWLAKYRAVDAKDSGKALEGLRVMLGRKLMWLNTVLFHLPALGLLGTVVGIAMSIEGSVYTNADNIAQVVDKVFFQIMNGLSVAFYTTIVGMLFMIWLGINTKLIEVESMRLIEEVLHSDAPDVGASVATPDVPAIQTSDAPAAPAEGSPTSEPQV